MGARLSLRGYALVLSTMRDVGQSAAQVSEAVGVSLKETRLLLRRMEQLQGDLQLIRLVDWTPTRPRTIASPIYRLGQGSPVDPPMTFRSRRSDHQVVARAPLKPRSELIAFAFVVRALRQCALTRPAIAELAGLNEQTVGRLIVVLREHGLVHIERYQRVRSGVPAECFRWGHRPDASRPPKSRQSRTPARRIWEGAAANSSVFHQRA